MIQPKNYRAIMLLSTFTDLKEHRQRAIEAIAKFGFMPNVMEFSGANAETDVIDTSLGMVRDSAAYVGILGFKYGQTPIDPVRNPNRLSITELEFNEAMKLGRPIVLFIMDENHPLRRADIEGDPEKGKKLKEFHERAKLAQDRGEVQRVYEAFDSLEQFAPAAAIAIGNLVRLLERNPDNGSCAVEGNSPLGHASEQQRAFIEAEQEVRLPSPPALVALPRYLGSHSFVGRESELLALSDWCDAADPNPMLLLEAIGGSGKSMLAWEWLTRHARSAREDWAGLFWYSFYEKGAVMADFCCAALAYMTETDVVSFRKLNSVQLSNRLMAELEQRPWLFVLDGLERILVAYHRHDAAQMLDSEAAEAQDQIAGRDACAAIRPEDDRLLRRLAAAAPSKILVSSRLTPRALINLSRTTVPGVRRQLLPGLRPADAEAMVRSNGVFGDSRNIRNYLQKNCDCHPLVIGVLAGLINDYPPDRGNFDRWTEDPGYGMSLNLGKLDLVQRRNHILVAAIAALDANARRLLHLLSLLQAAVDFPTLEALAIAPSNANAPNNTEAGFTGISSTNELGGIIRDLEKRGLLQYDSSGRHYDLHPVVRGVAVGRIDQEETGRLGQRLLDYFTRRQHAPWSDAKTLEDVADGIQVVSAFIRMRRYSEAFHALAEDLANALFYNLGASAELLALVRGFFPNGWESDPALSEATERWYVMNCAAVLLPREHAQGLFERNILLSLKEPFPDSLYISLNGYAERLGSEQRLASDRLCLLAAELAEASRDRELIFMARLRSYSDAVRTGDQQLADELWSEIESMGRDWRRGVYRPGHAESERALDLLHRGELTEEFLAKAEELAERGNSLWVRQNLREVRGEWYLARKEPSLAIDCFSQALAWCRERGVENSFCEARLAMSRLLAGEGQDEMADFERLSASGEADSLAIAQLWQQLGQRDKAIQHATRAYLWALEEHPKVPRYHLESAAAVLRNCGAELPTHTDLGDGGDQVFPWEHDVRLYIGRFQPSPGQASPER